MNTIKTYDCAVFDQDNKPFYERRVVAQCKMQARYIYGAYLVVYGVLLLDSDTVTVKRLTLKDH